VECEPSRRRPARDRKPGERLPPRRFTLQGTSPPRDLANCEKKKLDSTLSPRHRPSWGDLF
jgi:hypothetical protein